MASEAQAGHRSRNDVDLGARSHRPGSAGSGARESSLRPLGARALPDAFPGFVGPKAHSHAPLAHRGRCTRRSPAALEPLAFLTDTIREAFGACEGISDANQCSSGANPPWLRGLSWGALVERSGLEAPQTPAAVPPGSHAERPLGGQRRPSAPKSGIASATAPWQESRTPAPPIALLTVHRR
jgi:hypothetical protein